MGRTYQSRQSLWRFWNPICSCSIHNRIWDRIASTDLITAALIAAHLIPEKIPSARDPDQLIQHSSCHAPSFQYHPHCQWCATKSFRVCSWGLLVSCPHGQGTEQSWKILKETFFRVQELSILRCSKSGKKGKSLAWLNWDLLMKLKSKKKMQDTVNRGGCCEKSIRKMWGCVGMGSGSARCSLNWMWLGMPQRTRKASTGTSTRRGESRRAYCP